MLFLEIIQMVDLQTMIMYEDPNWYNLSLQKEMDCINSYK